MSAQFEEEVIVSHIINRDNAGIGVTRNIGRSIPKTPPPLWAVTERPARTDYGAAGAAETPLFTNRAIS